MSGLDKILKIKNISIEDYDIFIETGLYDAKNISSLYLNGTFSKLEKAYSIELNKDFIDKSYENYPFLKNNKINLLHGDSGIVLDEILTQYSDKKILLWLDAHYSGGNTSKSKDFGECPLVNEIECIKNLKIKPTIIIDDLGCFLKNTPHSINGWPDISNIEASAKKYFNFTVFLSDRDELNQLHYAIFD